MRKITATVLALAAFAAAGCGANRGQSIINSCRAHDGVVALDDDVVICADQTLQHVDEE